MKVLRISCMLGGFLSLVLSMSAQTFNTLDSFDGTDGENPYAGLVQASNGNLYGTTYHGGAYGHGTVFTITPGEPLKTLHSFCSVINCPDGNEPAAGLVQATNGNLYGTTYLGGGAVENGTVFKITPSGTLTTLHGFVGEPTDGLFPYSGLIQASNGNLYGTTGAGGANNLGTVFEITPGGTLTTLHSFDKTDGSDPVAGLVQATNGDFYGTTGYGGANNFGTVFEITPSGTLTTLHSFDITDGSYPFAGLIQATNGNLYGTTYYGGANNDGTVFEITPSGTLTTLYNFCSQSDCADGNNPYAGLVQATDGNLYGTTYYGGANGDGTVFKITLSSGTLTTLYSFCPQSGCADGYNPYAGLVQDTNGDLYGTTYYGGTSSKCTGGCGTIFSLSVGLGPFVETQPASGKVGAAVKILGTNLTGATSVTFNGTAATFAVVSKSKITTTVPAGATTGTVKVTTSSGTLKSNTKFRVAP